MITDNESDYKSIVRSCLKITKARASWYALVDEAAESHAPIKIMGKRHNAVLVSEDDWRSIEETLYLLSIPGIRESIRAGMKTSAKKCAEKLVW